jgi:hypothetical protein
MAENEAPVSSAQPDPFSFLDRAGYASYSHVDLLGIRFSVNQQIGIPVLVAAVAALVGEDEVFSEGVVKLASNDRCADQSAREQEARARERETNVAEGRRSRSCSIARSCRSRQRKSGSPI